MESPEPALDDRCPYEVAQAVIRTIDALDPAHPGEEAIARDFIQSAGKGNAGYLLAIARSRHSVFYAQLLRLYDFGRSRVPEAERERFCFRCGQTFAADLFRETLHPLLRVAMAEPGGFHAAVEAMIHAYLARNTGVRYRMATERSPGGIRIRIRWASPAAVARYLAPAGLDPARCLGDSVAFIAGAVEGFASRIIEGYTPDRYTWSADGGEGVLDVVAPAGGRFAYERLLQVLVGHVQEIEGARGRTLEVDRLESDLIVGSPVMRRTWELMRRAGRTDDLVLLRGESGTGKSELARKIHGASRRREGPFVEVAVTSDIGSDNLVQSDLFGHEKGAFTGAGDRKQGLFSLADGGTIFLDEIGDAAPDLQAKLLRVLESSTFRRLGGVKDVRVDVRVIAATNRDLEAMVKKGTFREDLYYRLAVIPIHMPPLRDRAGDVPALAEFLLQRSLSRGTGPLRRLGPGVADRLASHPWPGNIRELDHAIKYAAAMAEGEVVEIGDFPAPLRDALAGTPPTPAPAERTAPDRVVDPEALRRALRAGGLPRGGRGTVHHGDPRHIDHARRVWLETLLDEYGGDLKAVAACWDRTSEKTLRALVRSFGLGEALAAARARGPRR